MQKSLQLLTHLRNSVSMCRHIKEHILKILAACVIFCTQPALAQSELETARAFLEAGKYQEAIEIAELLPAELGLDATLIRTRAFLELGDFQSAKLNGRQAVSIAPTSFDARFLFALALERSGENTAAVVQYRRAIDFSQSDSQRRFAATAVQRIGSTKAIALTGSVGLAPSTNFNKATANDEVDLVFGTAEITSADPRAGVGLTYSVSASFQKLNGFTVETSGLLGSDTTANQTSGSVSYTKDTDAGSTFSAKLSSLWVGGEHSFSKLSASSTIPSGIVEDVTAGLEAVSFSGGGSEVAPWISISEEIFRADNVIVSGEMRAKRHISRFEEYASSEGGVSVSAAFELADFDAQVAGSLNFRSWDSPYSLFPNARRDKDHIASIVISPNDMSFWGLKPVARLTFIDRQSNISIYEIQSQDFYVGYEAQF